MRKAGRRFMIDASMVQGGGGFTYAVNIIPRLARGYPGDRFRVFLRSSQLAESMPSLPNLEIDRLREPSLARRLRFTYGKAPRLAAQWKADVFYSVGEYAPVTAPCPVIASFQNLNVFERSVVDWPLRQKLRLGVLNGLARLSAKRCDRIHFVSEHSAQTIGDSLGIPDRKRSWIHHGIDRAEWGPTREARDPWQRPYILSVSSIYTYKNYVRLIEAYAELARQRPDLPDLVIVGDNQDAPYFERMQRARRATGDLAESIHILGEVPYREIRRYYAEAQLFVFPSYLESFGLPLLEAMASDVPLVASDLPTFREVAGDAAFYADPRDTHSLARAMHSALFAPGASEMLVKRGRERVRAFRWERTAEQLMALFESVLEERQFRSKERAPRPLFGEVGGLEMLPVAARAIVAQP